jgi:hypothetical protein
MRGEGKKNMHYRKKKNNINTNSRCYIVIRDVFDIWKPGSSNHEFEFELDLK